MQKIILISIDGMRPDGLLSCGHPFVQEMMKLGSYTLTAQTVFPSMTLPCHMSMFHSVPTERHGINTNHYTPMVRPLNGLFEQLKLQGRKNAMYYGWEPLRDVSRPESLHYSGYIQIDMHESADTALTDLAISCLKNIKPDFLFLHLLDTDEKGGHRHGWMSQTYLSFISTAIDNVKRIYEAFHEEYTIIMTADHGGHDRSHGTSMAEDMTIPMCFIGKRFVPGEKIEQVSILDLAPTIADIMDIIPVPEWEGRSLAK